MHRPRRTTYLLLLPAFLLFFISNSATQAALLYGVSVDPNDADSNNDYSGSRVYQDAGASGLATIAWEITQNGNEFTYRYTFTLPEAGPVIKDVSHFTLDLSDDFGEDDETMVRDSADSNTPGGFDPYDDDDIEFGSKDGLTGAVKFNFGGGQSEDGEINTSNGQSLYYEFTVLRAPVWGNYAIKAGQDLFTNAGLGNEGTSMDFDDFIAVPNGIVPEPSSFALAAFGLLAFGGWCVRRRANG